MITVEQIQQEIESLSPDDYSQLIAWMDKRRYDHVVQGIEDIVTGKVRGLDEDEFGQPSDKT